MSRPQDSASILSRLNISGIESVASGGNDAAILVRTNEDGKVDYSLMPTEVTGHVSNTTVHVTSDQHNLLSSITVTATKINYLTDVTGNIQAQFTAGTNALNTHASNTNLHLTSSQNTWLDAITATSAEVNYLSGVTSAVQTQLDARLFASNNLSDLTNAATARDNLGLGSVENTALSGWHGSSNITILGSIASGTVPVARVSGLATSATTDTTNADNISTGTMATARLGSGTASNSTYLRGDSTWATIASGAGLAGNTYTAAQNITGGTNGSGLFNALVVKHLGNTLTDDVGITFLAAGGSLTTGAKITSHVASGNNTGLSFYVNAGGSQTLSLQINPGAGDLYYNPNPTGSLSTFGLSFGSSTDGRVQSYVRQETLAGFATKLHLGTAAGVNNATTKITIDNNGNVGIGQTSPTSVLHLKAGTASAGTAPLKLTAGTNLTTPENGTFEFDGTNLYFTIGGVRKTVTLV
jgi:hypothetical protein